MAINFSQRWIKWIGEALLLLLGVIALFQLTIAFMALWVNTEKGQAFVKAQLTSALADTPYGVEIGGYTYAPLNGLGLRDVTISDQDGVFLTLNKGALRANLLPLAARQAIFTIKGDHLTLLRLPVVSEQADEVTEVTEPFQIPDLYFRTVGIDILALNTLELGEKVAGMPLILSPRFGAAITLKDEHIALNINGRIETVEDNNLPKWLPRDIALKGLYDAVKQSGQVEKLTLSAPLYAANGRGHVAANGALDVSLTSDMKETDDLKTYNVTPPHLELSLKGSPQKAEGVLKVISAYQDEAIRLTSPLLYENTILNFSAIDISGPGVTGTGAIALDTQNTLASGSVTLEAADLAPLAAMTGQTLEGNGTLTATLSESNTQKQAAQMKLQLSNLQQGDISAASLNAQAFLPDIAALWPTALNITGQKIRVSPTAQIESLSLKLTDIEGVPDQYTLSLYTTASLPQTVGIKGSANVSGLRANTPALDTLDLTVGQGKNPLRLSGEADMESIDVILNANNTPLNTLPLPELPGALGAARLGGEARIFGPLADPKITSDFALDLRRTGGKKTAMRLTAKTDYADGTLTSTLGGTGTGVRKLDGRLTLPMRLTLSPFVFALPPETALNGEVDFALDGGLLAESFLPPDHEFEGNLTGDVVIDGTVSTPDINGNVTLRDGTYIYIPYDVELQDLSLDAQITKEQVTLASLSANDGEAGRLTGSGAYTFADAESARVQIALANFHLFKSDQVDGFIDADLALQPEGNGQLLDGQITLGEFNIMIPGQFGTSIPELNIVEKGKSQTDSTLENVALAIDIDAPQQIFVRGWGLDAEFGGNLDLTGTLAEPSANGAFSVIRGRYEEFGKRFDLEEAKLRFQGAMPPSPYLDIKAVTDAEDIEAAVLLTGPVKEPKISFSSVPSLPQDEVLSRILFGEDMSNITPFQAIQLTQTLRRFSGKGGGGPDALGKLKNLTGFDDIRVDSDNEGETNVGVGKYLTDKVYLEFEKGAGDGSGGATVQYELTPDINVESQIGQDAQGGAGINWNWDY